MSRVVISCYSHEDHLHCEGGEAVVIRGIDLSLSRKHEVVVISSFFPCYHRERAEPFRRIFLPTSRVVPRVGQLLLPVMLAGVARRIRHGLWIQSMPGAAATSLVLCITSQPVLALIQMRAVAAKIRRHISSFDFYERTTGPLSSNHRAKWCRARSDHLWTA
jgi:hypothetical protein